MDEPANTTAHAPTLDPVLLPDIPTEPHPSAHVPSPESGAGEGLLQAALPEIQEAARKVGGLKNLSEIAEQLHQMGKEA
jgi:hypothetical protein